MSCIRILCACLLVAVAAGIQLTLQPAEQPPSKNPIIGIKMADHNTCIDATKYLQLKIADHNSCVDAPKRTDGGLVHMVPCNLKNDNQRWEKVPLADDYFHLESTDGGATKCLDCPHKGKCHMIECSNDNINQKFKHYKGDMYQNGLGLCLDNPQRKAGGTLYVWDCVETNSNQKFDSNYHSGTDGGKVHLWTCDPNSKNQEWEQITDIDDTRGAFQLKSNEVGKCLDCGKAGGKCHMVECNVANQNQKFILNGPTFQSAKDPTKCLDNPQRNHRGGTLYLSTCDLVHGNHNQRFSVHYESPAPPTEATLPPTTLPPTLPPTFLFTIPPTEATLPPTYSSSY